MIGFWFSTEFSWEYSLAVVILLMVVGGALALPGLQNEGKGSRHDYVGTVLLTFIIVDLMMFTQLVNHQFVLLSVESLLMLAIAMLAASILAVIWKDSEDPIIPRGMTGSKGASMLCMFLAGFCGLGMVQFLLVFMLVGVNVDIYVASGMFLCLLAGGGLTSMIGLKKVNETGLRPWVIIGPILVAIGFAMSSQLLVKGLPAIGLCMFVLGAGLGCIVTEILCSIQGTTPRSKMGSVTSITMSARFIGILLGVAVYTTLIANRLEAELESTLGDHGVLIDPGWLIDNYMQFFDTVIGLLESSIEYCCAVAAALSLVILVVAYRFVDRSDVDAPEFIEDGEE